MTRTRPELLARIKALVAAAAADPKDSLDSMRASYLIQFLPFRVAKRYLRDSIDRVGWAAVQQELDEIRIRFLFGELVPAAFRAANVRRTVDVTRFLLQFEMFLWVLGDDEEAARAAMFERFKHFGKPQLVGLCDRFGLDDWTHWDDNKWVDNDQQLVLSATEALAAWRAGNRPRLVGEDS